MAHLILTTATANNASISSLVTSCTDVVGRSRHFAISRRMRNAYRRPLLPIASLAGQITHGLVQCFRQKYSASRLPQITPTTPAIPHPLEGRIAIVTDVGRGMRWTRQRRAREGSQGGLRPVSDQPARRRPALKRLRRNFGRQHMSRSKGFGGGSRGRQRRVVLAPVAGVKLTEICRARPGFGRSSIRQRRRPKEFGSGKSAL